MPLLIPAKQIRPDDVVVIVSTIPSDHCYVSLVRAKRMDGRWLCPYEKRYQCKFWTDSYHGSDHESVRRSTALYYPLDKSDVEPVGRVLGRVDFDNSYETMSLFRSIVKCYQFYFRSLL